MQPGTCSEHREKYNQAMMQVRTILVGAEAHQGTLLGDDGGVVVTARNGDPGQRLVAAPTARWLVRSSQNRAQHHLLLVQAATQLAKLRTAETKQGRSGHHMQSHLLFDLLC